MSRGDPMLQVFTGFDQREAAGWHCFVQSVVRHAREPVSICALHGDQRDGTNAFTYARFLVPYLCSFRGTAVFLDGADMLLRADINDLAALADPTKAVQVVKHKYSTKHPRKYVGTDMEAPNDNYPRKNWSSVVIWNCAHYGNRQLTPDYIAAHDGKHLHRFAWLTDDRIGSLSLEWNWLVDEYGENTYAKLLHWTAGIPAFPHYSRATHSNEWHETRKELNSPCPM